MKNKRKTCFALAITASIYLPTVIPAYASADHPINYDAFEENFESSCYIIDFLDCDGNLLDSRICAYGEKLSDIKTPEPWEDSEYIYQFIAWKPQLNETVTDCAAYIATYQKIKKNDGNEKDCTPTPTITETITEEPSNSPLTRASSDSFRPDEINQVTSTSYDVTSFSIETPQKNVQKSDNATVSPNTISKTEHAKEETTAETEAPMEKSETTQKSTHNKQEETNTPLQYVPSPTLVLSPTPGQTETPTDSTPAASLIKNDTQNVSANNSHTPKKKHSVPKAATKAKHTTKAKTPANSNATETPSGNIQKSVSESSFSETTQSSKFIFPALLLFIGIAAFGGVTRKIGKHKRT
ncbi:MAG: hypothetical protein HFH61_02820 [Lachnospiraceae bacterium]|nr:hypothetical protein [Lachnospiraceae bacterium]